MVFFQTLKQRLYKKRLKQNICSDQTKTIPGLQEGRGSMWRLERWQSPRNRMWKSSEKNRKRQPWNAGLPLPAGRFLCLWNFRTKMERFSAWKKSMWRNVRKSIMPEWFPGNTGAGSVSGETPGRWSFCFSRKPAAGNCFCRCREKSVPRVPSGLHNRLNGNGIICAAPVEICLKMW